MHLLNLLGSAAGAAAGAARGLLCAREVASASPCLQAARRGLFLLVPRGVEMPDGTAPPGHFAVLQPPPGWRWDAARVELVAIGKEERRFGQAKEARPAPGR